MRPALNDSLPAMTASFIASEYTKWGKTIKDANVRIDS